MSYALELSWLPEDPGFKDNLNAIPQDLQTAWPALVELAGARMDFLRTVRLDRLVTTRTGKPPPEAGNPIRLAVLASSTADHLLPGLRMAALRRGLWLTSYTVDYGQYVQELMDPNSGLYRFQPNVVLFAPDARHLIGSDNLGATQSEAEALVTDIIDNLRRLWSRAREVFQCQVIQQTMLPLFPPLIGSAEHRVPGTPAAITDALNAELRNAADAAGIDVFALDTRAREDGIRAWYDPVLWHRAKQEISPVAAPLYGDLVLRIIAARLGRSAKCLVLDLDNTLWGGVIGDDGLEGIVLGQGSAHGEAFVDFQRYAKALAARGVILAVCSKNDEAVAVEVFEKHPEMVLKRDDIACLIANWNDKPSNLRAVAKRLNIGLNSLVFADDNPFERNIVRRELPMVLVPELPEDPALFARSIADAGYFEGLELTAEDRARNRLYHANAIRDSLRNDSTDLDGYLRSLEMELRWRRFDRVGLKRIVQLVNKTNQFNLTTRRYSEVEIEAVMNGPQAVGLQLRLLDKFGDNGMIAVLIGRRADDTDALEIESWLMSCRVLGRGIEQVSLNLIAAEARRLGLRHLIGEYRPTSKNDMVREHYSKLGFERLVCEPSSVTRWVLPLERFTPFESFVQVTEDRV